MRGNCDSATFYGDEMKPTICETCKNMTRNNATAPWYKWQCMKFKRMEGFGFVTEDIRESDPYMYCKDINGGECPLYEDSR